MHIHTNIKFGIDTSRIHPPYRYNHIIMLNYIKLFGNKRAIYWCGQ